ncbi:MAG: response regulator transcription factor [Candidatus Melainabacteria bacterium]
MLKLLLIDDEPNLIRDILTLYGFEVDLAKNGLEGLKLIQEHNYDLVILDLMMPVMDGWEVLNVIRHDPIHGQLPIIMLTSCNNDTSKARGLNRGADMYLTKPVDPTALIAQIKALHRRIDWQKTKSVSETVAETSFEKYPIKCLTERENEILDYIAQGRSSQWIADNLVISILTVKNHIANIFKKLNVSNRTQAASLVFTAKRPVSKS